MHGQQNIKKLWSLSYSVRHVTEPFSKISVLGIWPCQSSLISWQNQSKKQCHHFLFHVHMHISICLHDPTVFDMLLM